MDHSAEVEFLDLNASPVRGLPPRTPNPMDAGPGESTELPERDRRLSETDESLPKVKPGDGEGPEVVYGKDLVLDMAGYHSKTSLEDEDRTRDQAMVQTFADDLLAAARHQQRPMLKPRTTDPLQQQLSELNLETRRTDRATSEPPELNTGVTLRNVDDNPFLFVLDLEGQIHSFEMALCDDVGSFPANRVSFQKFIEDAQLVDDPRLVVHYHSQ